MTPLRRRLDEQPGSGRIDAARPASVISRLLPPLRRKQIVTSGQSTHDASHSTRSRIMFQSPSLSSLQPAVIVHLFFAIAALVLGPLALWLRKGSRLHRGSGYAWVTMMAGAALSSVFIRDFGLPNVWGYTPIHLLTIATLAGIGRGVWFIANHQVMRHRRAMQMTYVAVLAAGAFALLPHRYLGGLVWHHAIGMI
jgi:uncharacterized membrane protein